MSTPTPPAGYELEPAPTPPAGYSLDDVPAFLRPTAAQSTVATVPGNGRVLARVQSNDPTKVQVMAPKLFGQPQLDHEEDHVFQYSRNPAVVAQMESKQPTTLTPQAYSYGGVDGLLAAQRQHKTITDFNMEQQADMESDYARLTKEAIASGDAAQLDKLKAAYGPYVRQQANLPGKNDSMTTMSQQDLTPPPPGLPPSTETGILAPDPLLGGAARVIPPPGYVMDR